MAYVRIQSFIDEENVKDFINQYNDIQNKDVVDFLCHWEDINNEVYENEIANRNVLKSLLFEKKHYIDTYDEVCEHAQDLLNRFFGEINSIERIGQEVSIQRGDSNCKKARRTSIVMEYC